MKAKLNNFLHSDIFILAVALLIGFLCHFFVITEILASDKKEKDTKSLKLQSLVHEDDEILKLSALLESNLNISISEDDNYKYVDIETNDKSLKIEINDNFINIQKKVEKVKTIEKVNEKFYSSYASNFSRSLSVPDNVDHKKAEIIKPNNAKADKITIKFPKLKFTNS